MKYKREVYNATSSRDVDPAGVFRYCLVCNHYNCGPEGTRWVNFDPQQVHSSVPCFVFVKKKTVAINFVILQIILFQTSGSVSSHSLRSYQCLDSQTSKLCACELVSTRYAQVNLPAVPDLVTIRIIFMVDSGLKLHFL